ncbi:aminotransferase class V-fold PLP-dependent enzyme [Winogradskyella sp. 3972H.M.0a.05]|uniref:aminotransferase class V-fold PLP-dependent enzyme n=1 Tax=Winogradskyella sp. 3972H.M.0a.05 TaxID=2950277 RepID=UPI0033932DE2
MTVQHQKHLFDLPDDVIYLNIASQSPSFKTVTEAGLEGIRQKSLPYTITISDYFDPVIELRKLFAQLIDVDEYNRIANIPSVSYGMASIANNITLKEGDEIILIEEQFPSNYYIWERLAKTYNATLKTIAQPKDTANNVAKWNEDILNAISDKTALVTMGNIHWSNGSLFNLKAIREKTRTHNSLLVIDGSQSIGAYPFSVKDIEPDALVSAGYKWLFGPYGCAYAYFGPYFDNGTPIEENWCNRLNSEDFTGLTSYESQYKPLASRYAAGEGGSFIYVRMQIAALKSVLAWQPETIQDYCKSITKKIVSKLKALGCHIEDDANRTHHLFGVKLPETIDIDALKEMLKAQNIYISFRGQYIRLSCHLFNTEEDFDKLYDCIASTIKS